MVLVAGLGNPGPQYALHRHNVGFMVADLLKSRLGVTKDTFSMGGQFSLCKHGQRPVLVLKPMEYMNLSGQSVGRLAQFYKIPPEDVVVIHDELDLPFGQLMVKKGGGHGGHNGLRSIMSSSVGSDFLRVRVGIGRPSSLGQHKQVSDYVLSPFDKVQQQEVPLLLEWAADAVQAIIDRGVEFSMNHFNRKVEAK